MQSVDCGSYNGCSDLKLSAEEFNKVKELRKEKGLTQAEIAKILNIKQQSYLRYEQNTAEPSFEILVSIARFYGVSTDYLLGLSDY
ncbi:MAG: helix-turn-helix transcriptional regulator [Alphaproteobacteria bacterium]|nr:helix-turn-helix transcriptional regulator [Alphaproteobacteria bacterium]